MNRRGFLKAILAAGVAPAVVGSGVLMPVRGLISMRPSGIYEIWSPFVSRYETFAEDVAGADLAAESNLLLTPTIITREALRVIGAFDGAQWSPDAIDEMRRYQPVPLVINRIFKP